MKVVEFYGKGVQMCYVKFGRYGCNEDVCCQGLLLFNQEGISGYIVEIKQNYNIIRKGM